MREPRPVRREVRDERDEEFRESLAAPAPVAYERSSYFAAANVVYVLFGILEAILALRFLFLLFGANTASSFVNLIYALSEPFVAPFYGVFGAVDVAGSISLFDGTTLLAMVVYAVICWGIIRLIAAINNRPAEPL